MYYFLRTVDTKLDAEIMQPDDYRNRRLREMIILISASVLSIFETNAEINSCSLSLLKLRSRLPRLDVYLSIFPH